MSKGRRKARFLLITTALLFCFYDMSMGALLMLTLILIALMVISIRRGLPLYPILLAGGTGLIFYAMLLEDESVTPSGEKYYLLVMTFNKVAEIFSEGLARLGLAIMILDGFSRYMNEIGAAQRLVEVVSRILTRLHSPAILLGIAFIFSQLLMIVIPSPSGLALLLMFTLYPILCQAGCHRLSSGAVIASASMSYGPMEIGTNLIALLSNIPVMTIFLQYQFPVLFLVFILIAILHIVVQQYWEQRESPMSCQDLQEAPAIDHNLHQIPAYYAFFPFLPLILAIFWFMLPEWGIAKTNLGIIPVIFIALAIIGCCEILHTENLSLSLTKMTCFFKQMGDSFSSVVSLLLCAQVFSEGIVKSGLIQMLLDWMLSGGAGPLLFSLGLSLMSFLSALVTGSSAVFNAFAPLAADMARQNDLPVVSTLLAMYYSAGIGRAFSPVAAFIIIIARTLGISPRQLIMRNVLQLSLGYVLLIILTYSWEVDR